MARPFTYISSKTYYDLEIYFFKLNLYTDSEEYFKLTIEKRNKIDKEIMKMREILDIMNMFRQTHKNEKPIIGWNIEGKIKREFGFSTVIVAAKCLNLNPSHIVAICKKKRKSTGGYSFKYYE